MLICGLLLVKSLVSYSQLDIKPILTGQFMYDYYKNPVSYLYYDLVILQNPSNTNSFDTLHLNIVKDFFKEAKNNEFAFIGSGEYMLFKRNGGLKFFRVLKNSEDYVLLCKENRSLCDCKTSMSIYFTDSKVLKNVERPFSFSLKKNLIYKLNRQGIELKDAHSDDDLCKTLEKL